MLEKYYSASKDKNTFKQNIAAPYIRKSINIDNLNDEYFLYISVIGIYELSVNGKIINKGYLLPYRTNPNHVVYFDKYDLNSYLQKGENVIGIILGNGFSNSICDTWDFDKLSWANAPKISLEIYKNNKVLCDVSSFKCHPSEVIFDDYHLGEHIDANKIIEGWNKPNFDDGGWDDLIEVTAPLGEKMAHPNFYPMCYEVVKPIKSFKSKNGYVFDFGSSFAGVYEINIKGSKNHLIKLFMGDAIREDKSVFTDNIACFSKLPYEYRYYDWFILSGGNDTFRNRFNYKAGRFVELYDLSEEEYKTIQFKMFKISSLSPNSGNYFRCDNEIINQIQTLVINSDISNYFYFPTDCPHREKNGWTGDAALSSEQFLLNFSCFEQQKEYLKNVIKAQNQEGTIPGIVPTDTWGFAWENGPGWDIVLFELPLRSYIYSGDIEFLNLVHEPIQKYLKYMETKANEKGLFAYGLGDWLPARIKTPLEIIDSLTCKNICDLAAQIFHYLDDKENEKYALDFSKRIKEAFNSHYIVNYDLGYVTQAWCAMSLAFNMTEGKQKEEVINNLYYLLQVSNYHIEFGANANRYFWRVLGDLNEGDIAIKMMAQDGYGSFKDMIDKKGTTLFEAFKAFNGTLENLPSKFVNSMESFNHHFWGDISSFFYRYLAGIRIDKPNTLSFAPIFTKYVNDIDACVNGIKVKINKKDGGFAVNLYIPKGIKATLKVPDGYRSNTTQLKEGINDFFFALDN